MAWPHSQIPHVFKQREPLQVKTSDILNQTKSFQLHWRESSNREIWEKEKYEATDGSVTNYISKTIPSVPYAPREAYPLVEYVLESSSEGVIEKGRSSELEELCKLASSA
jgi:hypothetical protein